MSQLRVFFISANAEPSVPGPEKYGVGSSVVLIGAPDREKAEEWAKHYVQKRLLDGPSEQKLTELKIVPIHDTLFTHEGSEKIDWTLFPAEAGSHYKDHPHDFHSSGSIFRQKNKSNPISLPEGWDNIPAMKESMGGDASKFNWDEKRQFYYLIYSDSDAFITKSLNLITSVIPFIKETANTSYSLSNITTTVWPGAKEYNDCEADYVA